MGREIRRVPKGWQHPKDEKGIFQPLYDQDYDAAAQEWLKHFQAFEAKVLRIGRDAIEEEDGFRYYWEYGYIPQEEYYRPAFTEPASYYQIYETVTEGSPTSPVFETLDELEDWLVSRGTSSEGAKAFREKGFCFSMMVLQGKGVLTNYEGLAYAKSVQSDRQEE